MENFSLWEKFEKSGKIADYLNYVNSLNNIDNSTQLTDDNVKDVKRNADKDRSFSHRRENISPQGSPFNSPFA